jgi:hypothetical protein
MAKLPQAIDYGARPNLGVNRLDRPSVGGVDLSEALNTAVTTFDSVMKERKAKEDRLNYGLARNEIQKADLEARDELAEDQDWATHDERYSTSFKTKRDEIMARYGLSQHDSAILSSESDLIGTQGRISVGGAARKIEVKQGIAKYKSGQSEARMMLDMATDGPSRNNIVLGQLDVIDAAEEAGYLDAIQAQSEREAMTQDFALSSIQQMSKRDQIRILSASLAYRKGYSAELGEFSGEIIKASETHGIPAELIAAQIQQESSGDPNAISKAGAQGVMQLMPDAATELGVTDRFDPGQSIDKGTQYLAKQLKRFEDPAEALAAYNWGSGNLLEAKDKYGDDWLAHAPQETKDYVAALLPVWESAGEIKTNGKFDTGSGPLTAEAIRNGEGTDSIADFLHGDTAAKMLAAAKGSDVEDNAREASQNGLDLADRLFPESHEKRMDWIKRNLTGKVREYAETNAEQMNNSRIAIKARANVETMDDTMKAINAGTAEEPYTKDMIDTDAYTALDYGQQKLIDAAITAKLSGTRHAPDGDTHISPRKDGLKSLDDWRNLPDYEIEGELGPLPATETKETANLDSPEWALALDETAQATLKGTQKLIIAGKHAQLDSGGRTQIQIVSNSLDALKYGGVTDEKKRAAIKGRLLIEFDRKIREKQNSFTPPKTLNANDTMKIWNQMLIGDGEIDVFWGGSETVSTLIMTTDQLEEAFSPLGDAKAMALPPAQDKLLGGYGNSVYDYLLQKQKSFTKTGTEEDLSRAWFAYKNGMSTEEINRRLKGE